MDLDGDGFDLGSGEFVDSPLGPGGAGVHDHNDPPPHAQQQHPQYQTHRFDPQQHSHPHHIHPNLPPQPGSIVHASGQAILNGTHNNPFSQSSDAITGAAGGLPIPGEPLDVGTATAGADMNAIMAENVKEMRRRSLANGFGMEYMTMGDDEPTFQTMVSPTYDPRAMAVGHQQIDTVTQSLEGVLEMNEPPPPIPPDMGMMGYPGRISAPEMQNMYSPPEGTLTPTQPDRSPGMLSGSSVSVPPTPSTMGPPSTHLAPGLQSIPSQHSSMSGEHANISYYSGSPAWDSASPDVTGTPSARAESKPPRESIFGLNAYSTSGMDMMDILTRVVNRPQPQINIGAVDMSCAFVVTDNRKFDNPIVYCSATFERLTGYTKHEILGRNCRFLQAPEGNVKPGEQRKYVDPNAVYYLKTSIEQQQECQQHLINYRKGGQSFTNLLTMIPISIHDDWHEITHFVGFQVDLVDQPGAMLEKNNNGSFAVNYSYQPLPSYIPQPQMSAPRPQYPTGAKDQITAVLHSLLPGADGESQSKRALDKVLLQCTDDVVHVLSLKGLFLYCSPSIRKVLEYEPHELVGTSLSAICHPSDIVPVTRDLKDTSVGSGVNVVFRIRRRFSGYTWFEGHGCLHTEQGKGRKCIILVGRERPVYGLRWKDVLAGGGIGENELWTKVSTSGMFLFVSSNVKMLLDREPDELVGTSMQALMRPDSKEDLLRALVGAREKKRQDVRHEMQTKRGNYIQALTTLYPGDGEGRRRPTFFIAQTRLLKQGRQASQSAPQNTPKTPTPAPDTTPGGQTDESGEQNDASMEPDDNMFEELKTTRSTSWQFELRQMQRTNKRLGEELNLLLASKKKRKRRKGQDQIERDCANCHTKTTPEWRRGPSGKRDLCNSCGLRYAKLMGRGSSRTAASNSDKGAASPAHISASTSNSQQSSTSTAVPPDPATLHRGSTDSSGTPDSPNPARPILTVSSRRASMGGLMSGANASSPQSPRHGRKGSLQNTPLSNMSSATTPRISESPFGDTSTPSDTGTGGTFSQPRSAEPPSTSGGTE